jgi:FlaA1/EpsC-like NDP-sugar epimerase
MEPQPVHTVPEPNPVTRKKHRREVFYQITLPLGIGLVVIVFLMIIVVLSTVKGQESVSQWADVALIWLILQSLVIGLVFLVMLAGMVYAVTMLLSVLPGYAHLVQDFFRLVSIRVRQGSDKAVEPILRLSSFKASVRALFRR